jgi:hypothetical protein
MRQVEAAQMASLNPRQMAPEPFAGIQLGGRGRQPRHLEPRRRSMGQERLDDLAAVNRGAIPAHHQAAGDLPAPMFQEGDHVCRMDGAVLGVARACSLRRDGADGREMIACPPLLHDGRVAQRRRGPDHTRQGREPGFVEEKDALPLDLGPLLMAGQVASRPCAIAASSRWRARRAGFWRRHRIASSTRLIWPG